MNEIAASSSAAQYGVGAYLVVFALMALSFAGIPAIGAAVVGWAAVLASQGKLNIGVVLIVAALGARPAVSPATASASDGAVNSWTVQAADKSGCRKPSPRRRRSTRNGDAWPSSSPRP